MGRSVKREVTYLRPTPPYDFDLTAAYTTYFRGRYGAESYEDHVFRRLLDLGDRVCLASVRSLPEEGVIRVLTGLPGVGSWTAQWLMIRALGRPDGFPHTDLALRRILGQLLNGDVPLHPDEALAYSRHWSPFRSYVTTYLFAAARSGLLTE